MVELMASEAGSNDTRSSHNPPSGRYMSSHGKPTALSLFNEPEVPRYRVKREQPKRFREMLPERQGQIMDLTV